MAWGTSAPKLSKDAFDSTSQARSALHTPGPTSTGGDQRDVQNVLQVHPDSPVNQTGKMIYLLKLLYILRIFKALFVVMYIFESNHR